MIEKIKNWFIQYRLNHHDCYKHLKSVDNYMSTMKFKGGAELMWSTSICKCKICGKRYDID